METATANANAAPPPPPTSSIKTTPAPKLAAALACNFCARVLLDAVVAPNCMHAFCAPCIDAWVEARAAACPCCVALGARQPTPLGDGAFASGRLQPDLALRSVVGKVMPFQSKNETGGQGASLEEEWNSRFAQALESAKKGAVAARGFLAEGAPCVGGLAAAGAAGAAQAAAQAAAAAAGAANTGASAAGGATTATGAPPRFSRAAPPARGAAVLLLVTPDPDAPRRRNPGYLQRPYVRAPRNLTLGLLGRYLSDRMKVTASSVRWRFEARGARRRRRSGEGGNGGAPPTTTTHDGTAAVAAVVAARGTAATMAEIAEAAWRGFGDDDDEDLERLDRPLVAFYRT